MPMDAVQLIAEDHRALDELLDRWERTGASSPRSRRALMDEITRATAAHVAVEERVLYPALLGTGEGEPVAAQARRAHRMAERALVSIHRNRLGDRGAESATRALIRFLRRHMREEQGRVLPLLRKRMTEERLLQVGRELQRARRRVPTRPHPLVPRSPRVRRVAHPIVAVMDRTRDAMREVRRSYDRGRVGILGGLDL